MASSSDDIPLITPKSKTAAAAANVGTGDGQAAGKTMADMDDEAREAFIQEYAAMLDKLKTTDPAAYQKAMASLQAEVASKKRGFEPKLPGEGDGGRVMGSEGISSAGGKEPDGIVVQPEPGFVVKTKDLGGRKLKVFINICTSEHVGKFAMKKKLNAQGNEEEGLNIPLSLGPPTVVRDKSGNMCMAYDVVVNPAVLKESREDRTGSFRHFLCQMSMQYVESKFKHQLDPKYKLPRATYKGVGANTTPAKQKVRKKRAVVIEEVDEELPKKSKTKSGRKSNKKGPPKAAVPLAFAKHEILLHLEPEAGSGSTDPDTVVYTDPDSSYELRERGIHGGRTVRRLSVRIMLPTLRRATDCVLDMSRELVAVAAPGYHKLEVFLPHPALRGTARASFDCSAGTLLVELDVDPGAVRPGPDEGSRPWLLARALQGGDADRGSSSSSSSSKSGQQASAQPVSEAGPLGSGVDEGDTFAEDKFLANDVLSQHYIQQKRDSKAKAVRDAEERRKKHADDPNVTYVDDIADLPKIWEEEAKKKDGGGGGGSGGDGSGGGGGGGGGGQKKLMVKAKTIEDAKKVELSEEAKKAKAAAAAVVAKQEKEEEMRMPAPSPFRIGGAAEDKKGDSGGAGGGLGLDSTTDLVFDLL